MNEINEQHQAVLSRATLEPRHAMHQGAPAFEHRSGADASLGPVGSAVVFVVDDDISVRESLDALIAFSGLRAETFASAQDFLDRPRHQGPSCMVLDVNLPHLNGLDLQRHIAGDRKDMPIIFITGDADVPVAVEAMKGGAADFLTKPLRNESLLRAIEGSLSRSNAALERENELRSLRARHATLSRREREVMALVVCGLLNKQVASELGISEITVKAHRGSVTRKMMADSLADLVNMATKLSDSCEPGQCEYEHLTLHLRRHSASLR